MQPEITSLPTDACGCERGYLCSYHEGYRDALVDVDTDPDASLDNTCRCGRPLDCVGCSHAPEDCDCSNVDDELAAELLDELGDQDWPDDPLARTLLGLPSGIHCHTNGCTDG